MIIFVAIAKKIDLITFLSFLGVSPYSLLPWLFHIKFE
jgi:hypothetical protein